ncbi:MAG: DUF192 domain-containing protein [Patescibacteria group bacterium]|nr:DUF192 domain-containing protein [Patescibacteria group bacterium]
MFKKTIFLTGLLAILLIAVSLVIFLPGAERQTAKVKINGVEIKAEIAKTPAEQYLGLSGREGLCQNCGMLFTFLNEKERTFVMRGMLFSIDIIWIDGGKIVKIDEELPLPVSSEGKEYKSGKPVNYVLEVEGGFCRENNIKVGDRVEYLK